MRRTLLGTAVCALAFHSPLAGQTFTTENGVLEAIWTRGMENSQLYPLAHELLDVIGPRLTGSPGQQEAHDWAVARYREWGIEARNEPYGSWRGWRRGPTHIDLLEPRVRTLEGTMLAWSPGTDGPVAAGVVLIPDVAGPAAFRDWLPRVRDRFVLISFPQPTCRPDEYWQRYAAPASFMRMAAERAEARRLWSARLDRTGVPARELRRRLEEAGAAGVITSNWSGGWGVNRVFDTRAERAPVLDLSCEDYGLVFRLAENGHEPVLRVNAEAEFTGEVTVYNTIAVLPGTELPDEYVVLSAHFDSWDGASGATDNGTGTVTMMEAMRLLREAYPEPRRTILAAHWSGEEQGLNGSRAFAEDNPHVLEGLQALFNQDNGTGRVSLISMNGFTGAGAHFGRWLAEIPVEIGRDIELDDPGMPASGGSDHASFVCHGAPAFRLGSNEWDYRTYTWHTNRDTFDKIAFDDLRSNATLVAMLAYLASEDPERMPRDRRVIQPPGQWPQCVAPARTFR